MVNQVKETSKDKTKKTLMPSSTESGSKSKRERVNKKKSKSELNKSEVDKGENKNSPKVNSEPLKNGVVEARNFRRIMIGEKMEDLYNYPEIDFETLESPCSLQEYLQDQIRRNSGEVDRLLEIPDSQSPDIWLYEHLRQVCLELSYMVVELQTECNSKTCPEMKASEFFFLCACHPSPQGCCAIDYIVHTLDGAISLLNNPKYFPSRISVPNGSIKHFLSISRRLYRIFAHTYFHHKGVFEIFENEHFLYKRFLKLSEQYSLIPPPLINIPDFLDNKEKQTSKTKVEDKISLNVNLNPNLVFAEEEEVKISNDKDNDNQVSEFEPLSRSDTVLRRE